MFLFNIINLKKKKNIIFFNKNYISLNLIKKNFNKNNMLLLINYLNWIIQNEPLSPFKHKIIRYFSIYMTWILKTSNYVNGIYLGGYFNTIHRKYSSSRTSIYNRYKHIFPRRYYRQVHIAEAIFVAFYHKNVNYLITFLKEMFNTVNFFKHRFLLYYLRAAFVKLSGNMAIPGIRGLFIKFRGKLAKAGNSRKSSFLLKYGQVTTNYSDLYLVEKFQIKTFTGAIGCTIIICYN